MELILGVFQLSDLLLLFLYGSSVKSDLILLLPFTRYPDPISLPLELGVQLSKLHHLGPQVLALFLQNLNDLGVFNRLLQLLECLFLFVQLLDDNLLGCKLLLARDELLL